MSKSKQNKAVALRYRADNENAPVVIAAGHGPVAERIIDIAEQKGIPVFRDDSAASLLCMLEVGRSIPPELYEVVAAIYCRILEISKGIKQKDENQSTAMEPAEELKQSLAQAQQKGSAE
ncbi:MAG: EscU/YscU/HrcU family type III secretion system export apparatus switch protein [Angelakisella sp.]